MNNPGEFYVHLDRVKTDITNQMTKAVNDSEKRIMTRLGEVEGTAKKAIKLGNDNKLEYVKDKYKLLGIVIGTSAVTGAISTLLGFYIKIYT